MPTLHWSSQVAAGTPVLLELWQDDSPSVGIGPLLCWLETNCRPNQQSEASEVFQDLMYMQPSWHAVNY
jgi:hypothetical protein